MAAFLDAHFHLELLLVKTGERVFGKVVSRYLDAEQPKDKYLIGNLAFPTTWKRVEDWQLLQYSKLYVTYSIHPLCVSAVDDCLQHLEELEARITGPRCVAIGEMGLDGSRNPDPVVLMAQEVLLRRQLQLARKHNLPVVIHAREGEQHQTRIMDRTREICGQELQREHLLMVHCFYSRSEQVKAWIEKFPRVRFSLNAKLMRRTQDGDGGVETMVKELDLDRMLLESDAPLLPPPGAGRIGHPWQIGATAEYIGRIKNLAPRMVLWLGIRNGVQFFNLA